MKNLIQSLQTLMVFAQINPNDPGSFSDLLDFYRQEPEGTEEELDKLADAITIVLAAPMPRVSSVRELLELSIVQFIDLTLYNEVDEAMKLDAQKN